MHSTEEVRLASFLAVFLALSLLETGAPRRRLTVSRSDRWLTNLSIGVINQLVTRMMFPLLAVGIAIQVEKWEWGVFHVLSMPGWVEIVLCMLILDLTIYAQHRLFHRVSWLWRLHRVHHTDLAFDFCQNAQPLFHTRTAKSVPGAAIRLVER